MTESKSEFFHLENLHKLPKTFQGLKNKPWVAYISGVTAKAGDSEEKRLYQVVMADFLLGDLRSGETTYSRFILDLCACLADSTPTNCFESVVRNSHNLDCDRKFLKQLAKALPMQSSASLFEVIVRASLKEKLPKRNPRKKVSNPQWLKRFIQIVGKDTVSIKHKGRIKTNRATLVNKKLNSITAEPFGISDLVIERILSEKSSYG